MTSAASSVIDMFRAAVRGDNDGIDRATSSLDAEGWVGSVRHILAVFGLAVHRRFPPGYTRADIIYFVADARAERHDPDSLPAERSEELIRVALGEIDLDPDLAFEEAVPPQITLAVKILRDADLSEEELDEFFAQADERVSGWSEPAEE